MDHEHRLLVLEFDSFHDARQAMQARISGGRGEGGGGVRWTLVESQCHQVEYECSVDSCGVTIKILPVETPVVPRELAAGDAAAGATAGAAATGVAAPDFVSGDFGWEVPPNAKYILVGCLNHEHSPIR